MAIKDIIIEQLFPSKIPTWYTIKPIPIGKTESKKYSNIKNTNPINNI